MTDPFAGLSSLAEAPWNLTTKSPPTSKWKTRRLADSTWNDCWRRSFRSAKAHKKWWQANGMCTESTKHLTRMCCRSLLHSSPLCVSLRLEDILQLSWIFHKFRLILDKLSSLIKSFLEWFYFVVFLRFVSILSYDICFLFCFFFISLFYLNESKQLWQMTITMT